MRIPPGFPRVTSRFSDDHWRVYGELLDGRTAEVIESWIGADQLFIHMRAFSPEARAAIRAGSLGTSRFQPRNYAFDPKVQGSGISRIT
jgi:hypothetical protein